MKVVGNLMSPANELAPSEVSMVCGLPIAEIARRSSWRARHPELATDPKNNAPYSLCVEEIKA